MNSQQIQKKYENQKQRIQELVFQIEKEYKEASLQSYERQKELEDREREIERMKQKLSIIRNENEELQQTANESFLRNSYLQKQIEETELESQQNMQIIQQMNRKINYLQDVKKNLENINNIHSNSIENASIMEQTIDEYKKQLEQNNIKIQKIDTEIQFSKERLEALLKKYQQLKMNEKSIKELQSCLDKEKNKYTKQMQNLSLQNSSLQGQVSEMHTSFVQIKQEVKANKQPRQQHTLAQIQQILTPEDFDKKPKNNKELSETSCKTFHLFQESSFMNKIKVTDFNSNNLPDNNDNESNQFLSVKHAPSAPSFNTELSNLQLAAPPGLLQQRSRNLNSSIKPNIQAQKDSSQQQQQQQPKNPQILTKLQQQSQQQKKQISGGNQQKLQTIQENKIPSYRQQLQQVQSKQNSSSQISSQGQTQQPKLQQQQIFQSQYVQQNQQNAQQPQQQASSQQKQTPTKQQIIQSINKNIQRNRATTNYGDMSSSNTSINNDLKQLQSPNIYESQKIYEKPENLEDTPKKSQLVCSQKDIPSRPRIAASVQVSSDCVSLKNNKNLEINNDKVTPGSHKRQKSNSIVQGLIIGASVVATAGLMFYKLAPKK